jgi:hypothetical protein
LSNRDGASLAILKEPAKKSVHHSSRRTIVGLSASNPFDLVPGNGKGSYYRLGLPYCEEGINRAPARIIALNNGTSDHSSDGGFSSIYCHKVPLDHRRAVRVLDLEPVAFCGVNIRRVQPRPDLPCLREPAIA